MVDVWKKTVIQKLLTYRMGWANIVLMNRYCRQLFKRGESAVAAKTVQLINIAADMNVEAMCMCRMSELGMYMCGMRMIPYVHLRVLSAHLKS